ncbi:MAG: hypothetical protein LBU75_15625 [Desulfovibrio sp.]|nr:hypothetical protein [Desulfovibrio sp.]
MGLLSSLWDGVKNIGRVVKNVVKKVYEVISDEKFSDVYNNVNSLFEDNKDKTQEPTSNAPDFFTASLTHKLEKKLFEQTKNIEKHGIDLQNAKLISAVQNEFSRLRISAELIDRSMANIKLHASGLNVHYHNMRNIKGLLDDVNSLRHGLKYVIKTINHNCNIAQSNNIQFKKIEGVDIDKKDGAISIVSAYDAFDRTREFLTSEILELQRLANIHLQEVYTVKMQASQLSPELSSQINNFIDSDVIPSIKKAESIGTVLATEVKKLPAACRTPEGQLEFNEEGGLVFEITSPTD